MKPNGKFTKQQIADYQRDGYVILKGLLDSKEVGLLRERAKTDREMDNHSLLDRASPERGLLCVA